MRGQDMGRGHIRPPEGRYMRAYSAQWAAFVEAVTKGGALPATLAEGVNALAVAEAATRAAKSGASVEMTFVWG